MPRSLPIYSIGLHVLLVALAASSVLLWTQNRSLRVQLSTSAEDVPSLIAGDPVASFRVTDDSGRELTLESSGADRLLLFFTTTCGACTENQAAWKSLTASLDRSTEIIGVSLDPPDVTAAYRKEHDLPYTVVSAVEPQMVAEELEVLLVPLTVRVTAQGRVHGSWLGVLSEEDQNEILAGYRSASAPKIGAVHAPTIKPVAGVDSSRRTLARPPNPTAPDPLGAASPFDIVANILQRRSFAGVRSELLGCSRVENAVISCPARTRITSPTSSARGARGMPRPSSSWSAGSTPT